MRAGEGQWEDTVFRRMKKIKSKNKENICNFVGNDGRKILLFSYQK